MKECCISVMTKACNTTIKGVAAEAVDPRPTKVPPPPPGYKVVVKSQGLAPTKIARVLPATNKNVP